MPGVSSRRQVTFELMKGGSLQCEYWRKERSSQRECKGRDLRQDHAWLVGGRTKRQVWQEGSEHGVEARGTRETAETWLEG